MGPSSQVPLSVLSVWPSVAVPLICGAVRGSGATGSGGRVTGGVGAVVVVVVLVVVVAGGPAELTTAVAVPET